jgi:hypothetical protein
MLLIEYFLYYYSTVLMLDKSARQFINKVTPLLQDFIPSSLCNFPGETLGEKTVGSMAGRVGAATEPSDFFQMYLKGSYGSLKVDLQEHGCFVFF